jgi:hypothetical protein
MMPKIRMKRIVKKEMKRVLPKRLRILNWLIMVT